MRMFKTFIFTLLLLGLSVSASATPWNVTISATNQLENVTFGYHPDASDGYDSFDEFTQTPIQGKVIMSLDTLYAKCIKRDNLVWNLTVGVPSDQSTTLSWDTSEVPPNIALRLYNTSVGVDINMKTQNSLNLGSGSHYFTIEATADETPPILTYVDPTPANDSVLNVIKILVNVTSNEPLKNAYIHIQTLNGTTWGFWENGVNKGELVMKMNNTSNTNWWINVSPPVDCTMRFWVNGSDLAGNDNSTETRYVTLSGYPPIIKVTYPEEVEYNSHETIYVEIFDATPSTYMVFRNGTLIDQGVYEHPFYVSIDATQPGLWNYTIWANDTFNNVNQTTVFVRVLPDTEPPILSFVYDTPANNSVLNETAMWVNITSNEPLSDAYVHIQVWNESSHTWEDKGIIPMNRTMNGVVYSMNRIIDYQETWYAYLEFPRDVKVKFWVNGSDLSGNNNVTESRFATLSGYSPEIYVQSPSKVPLNSNVNMTVVIYDATPSTYRVYKNDTLVREGSYQSLFPIDIPIDTSQIGTWAYTVWANDSFNNVNQTTVFVEVFQPLIPEIIALNLVVKPLDIVNITIALNNVTNATGVGFNLSFNPNVIQVLNIVPNNTNFNVQIAPNGTNVNNEIGFLSVAMIFNDPASTTQPKAFVDVVVRVVANETFTTLNFTSAEVSQEDFDVISPIKINGSLSVVGLKGDLNDNGRIDIGDVVKTAYMEVGKVPYDPKADFNLNGEIDITDLSRIAMYYVGKTSEI